MDNVIRPTFGALPTLSLRPIGLRLQRVQPLRVYGTLVGHFVALIRAETGAEGPTLQVIVGPGRRRGRRVRCNLPDDAESEADAEVVAFAILRTLEIVKEAMVGAD